jgi:hypothetical protein
VSPNAVHLEDRDEFAPADRYFIHDSGAAHGMAVHLRKPKYVQSRRHFANASGPL